MPRYVCPKDGTRLVAVASSNGQGDGIVRWECPTGDWDGPWFAGDAGSSPDVPPESFDTHVSDGTDTAAVVTAAPSSSDPGLVVRVASVPTTPVTATSWPLPTGAATEASLAHTKNRFAAGIRTTEAFQVTASGDNTVKTPAAGKRLRVHWVGMSSPDGGTERLVILKFGTGGSAKYRWYMGSPGAFSHWETIEGAVDEALVANLAGAATVQVNLSYEEI